MIALSYDESEKTDEAQLGQGANGTAYRMTHKGTDESHAVKWVTIKKSNSPRGQLLLKNARNEIAIMQKLLKLSDDEEVVVKFYKSYEIKTKSEANNTHEFRIAMELLEGGDLQSLFDFGKNKRPLQAKSRM